MKIRIINGPNLNLLGIREPEQYGNETLESINRELLELGKKNNITLDFFQSNIEGEIVDSLQDAFFRKYDGIIINAGGYTHTSVSVRDAIKSINIPCVEVHLSNIYGREDFRQKSLLSPVCVGQISGFGKMSYFMALYYFINK